MKSGKPLAKGQVVVVFIEEVGFFYELKSGIVGGLLGKAVLKGGKALIKNGGKLYSFIVGKNGKVVMKEVDEAAVKASSELKGLKVKLFGEKSLINNEAIEFSTSNTKRLQHAYKHASDLGFGN